MGNIFSSEGEIIYLTFKLFARIGRGQSYICVIIDGFVTRYSRFVFFIASDIANFVSVEGFFRNVFQNLRTLFLKMTSS